MFGLGWGELLIILLIVLAVFGTSRIAGLGGALGGSIKEFKKAVHDDDPIVPTVGTTTTIVEVPEKTERKV